MTTAERSRPYAQVHATGRERLFEIADVVEDLGLEFEIVEPWEDFERNLSRAAISLLGLGVPIPGGPGELLGRLVHGARTRLAALEFPIVWLDGDGAVGRDALLKPTPVVVLARADLRELLADEICREAARAARWYVRNRIAATRRLGAEFRDGLLAALRHEPTPASVSDLGKLLHRNPETLTDTWRDRLGGREVLPLKRFLDVHLVLTCGARKTVRLTWEAVAAEFGTTPEHLRLVGKRRVGRWGRKREVAAWLGFTDEFRRAVDQMFGE
jgi:hypothetical protein